MNNKADPGRMVRTIGMCGLYKWETRTQVLLRKCSEVSYADGGRDLFSHVRDVHFPEMIHCPRHGDC